MISRPFFFALISSLSFGLALPAAERVVQQSYPVHPGCVLNVATYRGAITIEESDESEVRITLQLQSDLPEGEANRAFDALQLEMKTENNAVSITARNPRETRVRFVWNDKERLQLAYHITVPRRCDVNLATANGGILVGNLTGRMTAQADGGSISFRQIDGSVHAVTAASGDLIVSRCSGDVSLTTLRGNIRTGLIGGKAELKTSTGDIEVQTAKGSLHASAGAGDVVVGFAREVSSDSRIETDGGDIRVTLDPAANCAVQASSVWGHVETAVPLTIDSGGSGKRKLAGRLNGGGAMLLLHASGGHVKITSAPQLDE